MKKIDPVNIVVILHHTEHDFCNFVHNVYKPEAESSDCEKQET